MRFARAAALVVTILFLALPLSASDSLEGRFVIDRSHSDSVSAAIDRAVAKMNPLIRGFARRRLIAANPAYGNVSLAFESGAVHIVSGPTTLDLPLNGRAIVWRHDGEDVHVHASGNSSALRETFEAKDGVRTNSFAPSAEGMTMSVTVTSPRLRAPLQYRLVYRRE